MGQNDDRIVNERDLPWSEVQHEERFLFRRKKLSHAAGGQALGCSIVEVPPGWRPWPSCLQHGNEEAIDILEGSGDLRLEGHQTPISAGSHVAFPRGPKNAHQIHNTCAAPLRYRVVSTMADPDITVYSDAGKLGLFAGSASGAGDEKRTLARYVPDGVEIACWEGA